MYVEGRVLTTTGEPIADAVIDTWETDSHGTSLPDNQWLRSCDHRYQGTTTRNTQTEPTQTVAGEHVLPKMVVLRTVLSFLRLIPFRVT